MKEKSRGKAAASFFTSAVELGITGDISDEIIINRFVTYCEAVATHQIDMPRGTLLLLAPDINPQLGAIYFYDRSTKKFYDLSFEEGQDNDIGNEEFQSIVADYDLKSLADTGKSTYLGELLFATLLSRPSDEAVSQFADAWVRSQPPRTHLDEFDA